MIQWILSIRFLLFSVLLDEQVDECDEHESGFVYVFCLAASFDVAMSVVGEREGTHLPRSFVCVLVCWVVGLTGDLEVVREENDLPRYGSRCMHVQDHLFGWTQCWRLLVCTVSLSKMGMRHHFEMASKQKTNAKDGEKNGCAPETSPNEPEQLQK